MSVMTAERPKYQINTDPLAEIGGIYRRWSDAIDGFRAELDELRKSKIFTIVHMPDGPEARRRRAILAPLGQGVRPNPYRELAPDKLDEDVKKTGGKTPRWVPKRPDGVTVQREPLWMKILSAFGHGAR